VREIFAAKAGKGVELAREREESTSREGRKGRMKELDEAVFRKATSQPDGCKRQQDREGRRSRSHVKLIERKKETCLSGGRMKREKGLKEEGI